MAPVFPSSSRASILARISQRHSRASTRRRFATSRSASSTTARRMKLTQRVLREVAGKVAVVRTDNRGLSAARNVGVSRTSGEYICAVDADDILLPTLVERSVERLDANPSVAFVSHWLEAFGDEAWEWKPERCDFPTLLDVNTVNGAALVRRTAVDAVGGWDEHMRAGCEDWDFWITLVERGFRGEIIPEVLFRYRRRPDSMSRVKFAGGGLRLYGRLVDKHAEAFRPYLQALAIRREVDTVGNRALADDLEARLELEVLPALARARDDLMVAERQRSQWKRSRGGGRRPAAASRESASSRTVEYIARRCRDMRERFDTARTEALRLERLRIARLRRSRRYELLELAADAAAPRGRHAGVTNRPQALMTTPTIGAVVRCGDLVAGVYPTVSSLLNGSMPPDAVAIVADPSTPHSRPVACRVRNRSRLALSSRRLDVAGRKLECGAQRSRAGGFRDLRRGR